MITRTPSRRASYALALAIAIAILPTRGMALGTPEQRAACTTDVFRLCGTEIPSVDHIIACLKKERPNLSEGCRAAVDAKR